MAKSRRSKGPIRYEFEAAAEVAGARALHERLRGLAAGGAGREVVLDASRLERIDTAALQAVVAALVALRAAGLRVSWAGASAQLGGAARLLGLTEALGLPA